MSDLTRRDFLKLATAILLSASSLLGLGALLRFLGYASEPPPKTEFDLGLAASYPLGSRTLLANVPAMLFHTSGGFHALSLVCTHLGCTVRHTCPGGRCQGSAQGFTCPCHGSRYDEAGRVLAGPAQKPLRSLRLETTAKGHLILHTD